MNKTKLSVTFIDDVNNREWTYDDVTKIETGINSVFVHCSDDGAAGAYVCQYCGLGPVRIRNVWPDLALRKKTGMSKTSGG